MTSSTVRRDREASCLAITPSYDAFPGRARYAAMAALFANPSGAAFEILLDEAAISRAEQTSADRLAAAGLPAQWAQVGVVYEDQYQLVIRDAVRFSDGTLGTYVRLVDADPSRVGVLILPIWRGNVLLIRHFRHATRRWHLEVPRGFGSSADARENALRELGEEIGASGAHLTDLGEAYPDTGRMSSRVALFCAMVDSYGRLDSLEGITEVLPTPVSELDDMIGKCAINDGLLLAAYARARARGLL